LATAFDLEKLKAEEEIIREELLKPDVYADFEKVKDLGIKQSELLRVISEYKQASDNLSEIEELLSILQFEASDKDIRSFENDLSQTAVLIEKLYVESLYNNKNDDSNALVEIHSGAGGEEAQDWAEMLERMYFGYADIMGYSVTIAFKNKGDGAGFKSAGYIFKGRSFKPSLYLSYIAFFCAICSSR